MNELADGMHLHARGAVRQKAIETVYRGYEFRSRLEAKWAAFFDLCGWKWSYEPPEFDGWIPDFALGELATLVEIKPFFHVDEWRETGTVQKIFNSGCSRNVLLLGADATWWQTEQTGAAPQIAWELQQDEVTFSIDSVLFGVSSNRKLGLCCEHHGWQNRVWRLPSGQKSMVWLDEGEQVEQHLVANWAEASNRSKWMPVSNNG